MTTDFHSLCDRLGYHFQDQSLLEQAFRHSSYVNEAPDLALKDNERLEFLGDAVLDLAVSHLLVEVFEDAPEGYLSKLRAMVVNERSLSRIARNMDLGEYLILGRGEELTQGRRKPSILANALEALIGAVYLDAGFPRTREMVQELFEPLVREAALEQDHLDYKSLIQEYTQERFKLRPEYVLVRETGPPHDRTFLIALRLGGRVVAEARGKSKKAAEHRVAKEAYFCLTRDKETP